MQDNVRLNCFMDKIILQIFFRPINLSQNAKRNELAF